MKRTIAVLLVLALLGVCAMAEPMEAGAAEGALTVGATVESANGLALALEGIHVEDEWRGEESSTHRWIVLDVTLTNYATETLRWEENLSAKLVYGGKYEFPAEGEFELEEIEPLVRLSGALAFRVPEMVAEAEPDEMRATLTVGETTRPVVLAYESVVRSENGFVPDVYFETPEEAIAFFAERVKNQDFLGAMGVSYARPAAESYDLAADIERMSIYNPRMAMSLPSEYEAYVALNALNALPTEQVYGFVTSLLAGGRSLTDGEVVRLDRDSGAFEEGSVALSGLTREQMIAMLDPARLAGLELKEIYRYEGELALSERNQTITLRSGALYGYSEFWDFVAIYELEGRRYAHGYSLVRYPQGWKISSLNSILLAFSSTGEAAPLEAFVSKNALEEPDFVRTWKEGEADPEKQLEIVDLSTLVGRWETATGDGLEFRADGTYSEWMAGAEVQGVWNANRFCLRAGESINNAYGIPYTIQGDTLTLYMEEATPTVLHRK